MGSWEFYYWLCLILDLVNSWESKCTLIDRLINLLLLFNNNYRNPFLMSEEEEEENANSMATNISKTRKSQ